MKRFQHLALLAILLALGFDSFCCSGEPRATFAFQSGWVEMSLLKDGKPVEGATVQIDDEHGTRFAKGETDESGKAAFPVPNGPWWTVDIVTGGRSADPIRLFKTETGVEPGRVLLSYGVRPCCRGKSPRTSVSSDPPDESPPSGAGGVFPGIMLIVMALVGAAVWARNRATGKSSVQARRNQ